MNSTLASLTPIHDTFGMIVEGNSDDAIRDLPSDEVISLFKQHGALVFRNFNVSTDTFLDFSASYCKNFSTYEGGAFRLGPLDRQSVDNNDTLLTVTGPTTCYAIPLHGEMYYARKRPELLWFYCQNPPAENGQTIICDGIAYYKNLSEDAKEFFRQHRLKFIRPMTETEWQMAFLTTDLDVVRAWCDENDNTLVVNDEDNSIQIEYTSAATSRNPRLNEDVFINPLFIVYHFEQAVRSGLAAQVLGKEHGTTCPILVRLEDGSEVPPSLLKEVEEAANELTAEVAWRRGDILMIDNTRVLHGRREYRGADRTVYFRAGNPAFDF